MDQKTLRKFASRRLPKKRCTDSSCRRIFSVDDREYIPARCPYCGKLYPRANEKYQIEQKKHKETLRRLAAVRAKSSTQCKKAEISGQTNLLWLLRTGKEENTLIRNLSRSLHITTAEAKTLADSAPILLGRFDTRNKAHKIGAYLSKAGATVWDGTSENVPKVMLEELNFSVRAFNCLKRAGFNTIKDLVGMSVEDLLLVRNLGRKCAIEVEDAVGNQLYYHKLELD